MAGVKGAARVSDNAHSDALTTDVQDQLQDDVPTPN